MAKKSWLVQQITILAIAAIALFLIFETSHLDIWISNFFYSAETKTFQLRDHPFLTQVMHHGLKSSMYVLGIGSILGGVVLLKQGRSLLRAKHLAVGSLGVIFIPALVALLKHLTNKHCPWSLDIYGGQIPYAGLFEPYASSLGSGQCFPAGHAAGGFMWFAWSMALMSIYPKLAKVIFYFAIVMGFALGISRMMQGAHFLSHVLWTAWFAWLISLCLAVILSLFQIFNHLIVCFMFNQLSHLFRRRILNTLKFSWDGLISAWKSEEAIRIELLLFPLVILGAYYLGSTKVEQILMVSSALLIIIVELLNTAIEKTIDRISAEQHPLSKTVKDVGSAAVLLAIVNFATTWILILV